MGNMGDERDKETENQIWGTWEDLLLAYSVRRHHAGGDFLDWDSVSVDVSNRTHLCKTIPITSQICQQRYQSLEQRFQDANTDQDIPWVEELRRIRIAELRRDVKRYDVSILLLQSKLKRLTERVGRNVTLQDENTVGDQKQDLGNIKDEEGDQERKMSFPALITSGYHPSVGSCDDTNSHEPEHPSPELVEQPGIVADVKKKISGGEGSCNGSTDSLKNGNREEEVETKKMELVRPSESGGSTRELEDSEDGEKKVSIRPPESGESISMSKEGDDVENDTKLTGKDLEFGDFKRESKDDDEKAEETKISTRPSESGDSMSKSKEDVEVDHEGDTLISVRRSLQSGETTSNLKEAVEVEKETFVSAGRSYSGNVVSKSKGGGEVEKESDVPGPPPLSDNSMVESKDGGEMVKETKVSVQPSESGESMVGSKNGVDMEKEKTDSLRPPASGESLAETMVDEDATKENSDVQSCSKRKFSDREKGTVSVGSSGNSKPCDADDASISLISDEKSRPLIDFLDFIRSHKDYSIFERAIKIQDSARYRNMIRQHIDMVTIRTKLEVGGSSYTSTELFRDLLLLCNNAIVFFPKNSYKFTAATHLRHLVNKEIAKFSMTTSDGGVRKPAFSSPSEPSPPSIAPPLGTTNSKVRKTEPELNTKTLALAGSFQTFGKRSLTSTKIATGVKKEEVEEGDESELKAVDKKKRSRPRTTKGRGAVVVKKKKNGMETSSSNAKKPDTVADVFTQESFKNAKKNGGGRSIVASAEVVVSAAKKKSAAGFLDRLKSSPSKSGSEVPKLKNTGNSSGGRGIHQINRGKGGGKKGRGSFGQMTMQSSSSSSSSSSTTNGSTKQTSRRPSNLKKRNVGRPPKRPPQTPPSQLPSKRLRVDREVSPLPPPTRNSRKRGKM